MNKLTQNVKGDKFNYKNGQNLKEISNQFKRRFNRLEQET